MIKRLSLAFLIVCIWAGSAFSQVNFNGDFERINPSTRRPAEWESFMANGTAYRPDSLTVKKGKYSLAISSAYSNARYYAISVVIPQIFKGNKLQLKGFIKTKNVIGNAGIYAGIEGTKMFDDMRSQNISGTSDWKEYTINLSYESDNAEQINIGAKLEGTGKAWFDDIRIYIDGKPIEQAPIISNGLKAKFDHEFDYKSGVATIDNNEQTIKNLTLLAQVWGFIKYHHPAVAKGGFNMDGELFRVMPSVLKATDINQISTTIEQWVDKFDVPAVCNKCKPKIRGTIVIQPDYGDIFSEKIVSTSLRAKLKYILENSNITKNYYVGMGGAGNPSFDHELDYSQIAYTDAGFRLLTLFRYWNMIQYFFPYRDVIGRDWNGILREFIPKYIMATDPNDYALVTLELIANVNDTHANILNSLNGVNRFRGTQAPPFRAEFIEDKLVVTGFYNDTLNVKTNFKIGDVITTINGATVEQLIKLHLPYTPASNYPTKLRNMQYYLSNSNQSTSTFQLIRDGRSVTVVQQNLPLYKINYELLNPVKPGFKAYKLVNNNIGYLYPGAYYNKDLPAIKALFNKTKAIIVDMRSYPSDFMPFTFVPYVKQKKTDFARFTSGSISYPGMFVMGVPVASPAEGDYKGKVIVLVNAFTQSQAEYTTMALQSSPNVTVIGSTTAAADGNVTYITLPGGISTGISGFGVFYPDGTPTQRVGVKIDVVIKPTIEGVKAGRDEVLEKAIELASK